MNTSESRTSLLLEQIYQKAQGVEEKYSSILFIPSESYDAPCITLMSGLDMLGIDVYTLKKPNINSWFCNQVIDDPDEVEFDFVLSNLHWGTRWSYYSEYDLWDYPLVLLDGDDPVGDLRWYGKYEVHCKRYVYEPSEGIKDAELSPFRWMEALHGYQPDIVFVSQNVQDEDCYFPFGVQDVYASWYRGKPIRDREIDFAHIPGIGGKRKLMKRFIDDHDLPGKVHNDGVWGQPMTPEPIQEQVAIDMNKNIHSYHRWVFREDYYQLLNDTKVLIYPGVRNKQWDSKRPWEALANGCYILYDLDIDVSQYPFYELSEFGRFHSGPELLEKARYLYDNPDFLEEEANKAYNRTMKYFTPVPLARYFLWRVDQWDT